MAGSVYGPHEKNVKIVNVTGYLLSCHISKVSIWPGILNHTRMRWHAAALNKNPALSGALSMKQS